MKPWQKDQLRRALELRCETLVKELRLDAARLREERGGEWTDVSVDVDQLDLTRDLGELRDMHAEPEAARCIECQRRHEKTYRR